MTGPPTPPPLDAAPEPGADRPLDPEQEAWVVGLLQSLPSPAMPADVVQRLQHALRAAADTRPVGPDDTVLPAGPPAVPGPRAAARAAARRGAPSRWLTGLVAAALVLVAAGVVVTLGRGSSDGGSTAVAAAPSDAATGGSGPTAPAAAVLSSSGTAYTRSGLAGQVQVRLAAAVGAPVDGTERQEAPQPGAAALTPGPDPAQVLTGSSGFTATAAGLRACVTALAGTAEAQALLVDRGTFDGVDAGVVVLAHTATTVDVWVVRPGCGAADPQVLHFHRVSWRR